MMLEQKVVPTENGKYQCTILLRCRSLCSGSRMQQLQVRMQVLQERYEDQSTTLRLVKETNGDLQVTFVTYSVIKNAHNLFST